MARAGVKPEPGSPATAVKAFEADLLKVLRGRSLEEAGWGRPDKLTLLVPLVGVRENGTEDPYLLRLHFGYYPEWPPSALFVNPETEAYSYPDDQEWLPRIEGFNELNVHTNYNNTGQMICASVTLEFYMNLHSVEERHVWNHKHQNFAATINAVSHALKSTYYKGPFAERENAS